MIAERPPIHNSQIGDFVELSYGQCPHRFKSCTQRDSILKAELSEWSNEYDLKIFLSTLFQLIIHQLSNDVLYLY